MSRLKADRLQSFSGGNITVSNTIEGTITNAVSSSFSTSASFATTSSYALRTEEGGFPFTGSAEISGSLTTDTFQANNDAVMPVGTTAQRPVNPTKGSFRYNTSTEYFEVYNGSIWGNINFENSAEVSQSVVSTNAFDGNVVNLFNATGGTITTETIDGTAYKIHTFTESDDFITQGGTGSKQVEYLVVAGGGSGGNNKQGAYENGGGGGAGGLITGTTNVNIDTYPVVVGAGGAAPGSNGQTQGSNSSVFGITTIGGGGGSTRDDQSNINGGSGGGAVNWNPNTLEGTGIAGQGYNGGEAGRNSSDSGGSGGGGGASQPGSNGSGTTGGKGGDGIEWPTGSGNYYAGGGGGGAGSESAGGLGGGGRGSVGGGNGANGENGSSNTGGGGGGNEADEGNAGNGGSGIVIIRYQV